MASHYHLLPCVSSIFTLKLLYVWPEISPTYVPHLSERKEETDETWSDGVVFLHHPPPIVGLKLRLKIEELKWKFFKFGAVGSDRFIVVNRKEKTVHRHQVSCDRF
ncbi:hypothetical protein L6452_01636 [Arctium lappa]|uniref:Uncharacterized protein n=1 Tax=Arctium lappa TaxID=4217 RepID=A0ACB9FII9_ARCLA|nr:hypothetical protein L6452_01636 [Arctium lappa]